MFKEFQFPDIHAWAVSGGGVGPEPRRASAQLALSISVEVGMKYCNISNTVSRINHLTQQEIANISDETLPMVG